MPHLPKFESQGEWQSEDKTSFTIETRERAFSSSSEQEAVAVAKTVTTATRRTTRTTRNTGASRRITEKMIDEALMDEKNAGIHAGNNFGNKAAQLRRTMSQNFDADKLSCWRRPFYAIVVWPGFDSFIGIIILLNGMTIGFDTQAKAQIPIGCDENCNNCPNPNTVCLVTAPWVGYLDLVCYGIYIAELILRFISFGFSCLKSNWVKFDMFLVATATFDLILTMTALDIEFLKQVMLVRLLRLARLARLVRLVVQFKTLWKLVSGLMSCANTLFWTFLLISILSYIAALFGMDMITYDLSLPADHPYNLAVVENFGALDDAMFTLMQLFTFDSIGTIYRPLIQQRPLLFFYFMTVLLVLSIALMNLVTAIMVEGALAIAEEDKEVRKTYEQARKKRQMAQLQLMFEELDEDESGEVTLDEIMAAPDDVKQSLFEIAGTEDIQTLFEMLDFDGGGSLETDEFCQGVFKAASSSKPLELDRLMKQCRDILMNSRKALNMIRGDRTENEPAGRKSKRHWSPKQRREERVHSGSEPPGSPRPRGASKLPEAQGPNAGLAVLESRVHALEKMASNMQEDTEKILQLLMQENFVKRAPAAALGPSFDEDLQQTLRPTSAEIEQHRQASKKHKKKKQPVVYSWSASPPVDADEVVLLRRRVAQLEAEIRKMTMQQHELDQPDFE